MSADRNTLLAQDKKVLHPLYHPTRHNDPFVVSHANGV